MVLYVTVNYIIILHVAVYGNESVLWSNPKMEITLQVISKKFSRSQAIPKALLITVLWTEFVVLYP